MSEPLTCDTCEPWRKEYNVAVANGLIEQARLIDRRLAAHERRVHQPPPAHERSVHQPPPARAQAGPADPGLREALAKLADEWEAAAKRAGERMFDGDPGATMATVRTLESCADALRASLAAASPETGEPGDPEPIANETESGCARRRELVAEARAASPETGEAPGLAALLTRLTTLPKTSIRDGSPSGRFVVDWLDLQAVIAEYAALSPEGGAE